MGRWQPKECKPKLFLVTNCLATVGDPLLRHERRARWYRRTSLDNLHALSHALASRVRNSLNTFKFARKRFYFFWKNLCFKLGKTNDDWIEMAIPYMFAAGLRHDEDAVSQGIGIVRGWVTEGVRKLTTAELRQAVEPLNRPSDLPAASLLVQAIDRDPMPEAATIALDWASLFPGSEPRVRRQPSDQSRCGTTSFRPELQQAAQVLRAQGTHQRSCPRVHAVTYLVCYRSRAGQNCWLSGYVISGSGTLVIRRSVICHRYRADRYETWEVAMILP